MARDALSSILGSVLYPQLLSHRGRNESGEKQRESLLENKKIENDKCGV